MNLYKNEALCSGCSACSAVCSRNAISMKADEKGFFIPHIDEALCSNCGLCQNTCPIQNQTKENYRLPVDVYAVINKDEFIRKNSRSGGIFMAIAEWIIGQGGVVYGAGFAEDLAVQHMRAETFDDCKMFQGSKYVQSDVNNTFLNVAEDLKRERYVLYSGTGCQVDGLIHYLSAKRINTDKLFLCDLVCHGNVSPKMYEDYRKWYEKKYNGKMTSFNFRDKSIIGWEHHVESFEIGNKKYMKRGYTELYYSNAAYRSSCYECHYSRKERVGDFTLADCWGAADKLRDMFDNKGISLLLVNSDKANTVINSISDKLNIRKVNLEDFMQPQLKYPIQKSDRYEEFWNMYKTQGFVSVLRDFGKQNIKDDMKRWIKWHLFNNFS